MEISLEKQFESSRFALAVQGLSEEGAKEAAIVVYNHLLDYQEMVRKVIHLSLNLGTPSLPQPDSAKYAIDKTISVPVVENERLENLLKEYPHLDYNDVVLSALRQYLERMGV